MFVDRSIITIDFPQDIVLSHGVRKHLCCWSLTADSHCLDWHGHVIQESVQSEISQEGQCQNNQGRNDYTDRSKYGFAQTFWPIAIPVGFLSQMVALIEMLPFNVILSILIKS